MKPPATIGQRSLTRLVQIYTQLLDEVAAGHPDRVAALKREARDLLERALHQLAAKSRAKFADRDELAAHLSEVRRNTLQAAADAITVERPDLKKLLYIILDPANPSA